MFLRPLTSTLFPYTTLFRSWIKIHNLPDHVYFNHSQHVRAGKVQCQTCHGEITKMDEVKQVAELSMGWCVNCHRDRKSTRLNSSHMSISYAVFCLKKKIKK